MFPYGNSLVSLGMLVCAAAVLLAVVYFILWRGEGRRLRKRLRETYGEQCCRPFRREYRKRGTNRPLPPERGREKTDASPSGAKKGES